jgi:MerR family transcriptional regulator, light-induced transcriptional regulator
MSDASGRFRIQVVSEMTGVPSPTLRAWERRYGIPTPARTASAYRLYSDRDVAMVRKLRDLCANGMSIAEAARVVKTSEDGAAMLMAPDGDPFVVAAQRLIDAILAFDARSIEREVARAQYLGPSTAVFERVFSPVMRRVGELWREGQLSVAQEHLASSCIGDTVRAMARLTNPDDATRLVLLACFAEEDHVLPVYGVSLRLASWGIATITLGVRTPPEAIAEAVQRLRPTGVGLSLSRPLDERAAGPLVEAYAQACDGVPWFVGGAGVDSIAHLVTARGGFVVEGDVAQARSAIERMLHDAHRSAAAEPLAAALPV